MSINGSYVDGVPKALLFRAAHFDFVKGVASARLWIRLGVQDIRFRYKRTFLGPLWITASMAGTFISMGMLFSAVFKNDIRTYLPYLATGMVTWNFISSTAGEGPQIFVDAQQIINSLKIPFVVHALRNAVKNAIIFSHNLAAALVAHFVLGGGLAPSMFFLIVSLPIVFACATSIGLILGIVGARFRDLSPIVGMCLQFMLFMTPIFWQTQDIPDGSKWWVSANPVYHLIEIVRAPILGAMPSGFTLAFALGTTAALLMASYGLLCLFRHRISYWL